MIELNSKQRKFLEKEAHDLSPLVIVGGAGLTEGVIDMVDNSLFHHELIKVKFNEYKDEKIDLTNSNSSPKTCSFLQSAVTPCPIRSGVFGIVRTNLILSK